MVGIIQTVGAALVVLLAIIVMATFYLGGLADITWAGLFGGAFVRTFHLSFYHGFHTGKCHTGEIKHLVQCVVFYFRVLLLVP